MQALRHLPQRGLTLLKKQPNNVLKRGFKDLTTKTSIDMAKKFLVNNYGGIIPFTVKHAAGPFISDGKNILFDNCAAYSSVTGGHNALPITNAAIDYINSGQAIHPSRAFYNQVLPQVAVPV